MSQTVSIRVKLPQHLRNLAGISEGEALVEVKGAVTPRAVLDVLEARYPALKGTIREHASGERRAYIRYFACQEDISHESQDNPLPDKVLAGDEPFWVIGAISGG